MSGKIMIQYDAVYAKTAELRSRLEVELREMEGFYRQMETVIHDMDSRTNAVFTEAMMENQRKAKVTTEALDKLLMFIELSARQVEHDELMLRGTFSMGSSASSLRNSVGSNDIRTPITNEGGSV